MRSNRRFPNQPTGLLLSQKPATAGKSNVIEISPQLGYDEVLVFVKKYGGRYLILGVQDVEIIDGLPRPQKGGRGR